MFGKLIQKILLITAVTALTAGAVEYERERYNVITERSPFGEDPTMAQEEESQKQQDAAALAAAKKMEQQMRLCYLLETETGDIRAGFQNLKAIPGEAGSFMLRVGENFKGIKLTSIDIANNSATITMNGKPITFELTQPKAAAAPAKKPTPVNQRRLGSGFRRQEEKPAEPELTPEEQAAKREEIRANLQQYQMEVLRQGMPPLPIPLTQEMDDQLVEEGVLPPAGP